MPSTPCVAANASTATRPAAAASQNARGGRSPARATAHAAVAAGSRPTTTLACAEDRCWSASEVKQREADHDADADEREARQVAPGGERLAPDGEQRAGERGGDERPPEPDERRVEVLDRERVAGSENENASTPTKPHRSHATRLRYRVARR